MLLARSLGREIGAGNLWIKDEGRNPTDSFKARGLSCAVTMAKKLGAGKLAIPSAGNAAGALAAYAAAAGLEAHIFMPRDVPQANFIECKAYGANVTLVDGLISDCGRIVAERKERRAGSKSALSRSRIESKARRRWATRSPSNSNGNCPTRILYPCGGGVGLIGMWKAFEEMEELGWIGSKRPEDDFSPGGRVPAHHAGF